MGLKQEAYTMKILIYIIFTRNYIKYTDLHNIWSRCSLSNQATFYFNNILMLIVAIISINTTKIMKTSYYFMTLIYKDIHRGSHFLKMGISRLARTQSVNCNFSEVYSKCSVNNSCHSPYQVVLFYFLAYSYLLLLPPTYSCCLFCILNLEREFFVSQVT